MRTTCNGLTGFDSLTFRQIYGGRGVNGYMLDCESGVAGSIPVDHPMGAYPSGRGMRLKIVSGWVRIPQPLPIYFSFDTFFSVQIMQYVVE